MQESVIRKRHDARPGCSVVVGSQILFLPASDGALQGGCADAQQTRRPRSSSRTRASWPSHDQRGPEGRHSRPRRLADQALRRSTRTRVRLCESADQMKEELPELSTAVLRVNLQRALELLGQEQPPQTSSRDTEPVHLFEVERESKLAGDNAARRKERWRKGVAASTTRTTPAFPRPPRRRQSCPGEQPPERHCFKDETCPSSACAGPGADRCR